MLTSNFDLETKARTWTVMFLPVAILFVWSFVR